MLNLADSFLNFFVSLKLTTFFFVILVIILTSLWIWLRHQYSYWKYRHIPYIKPVPIFGNIKELIILKKSPCDQFHDFYCHPVTKNQSAVGIYVFNHPGLLLLDTGLIKNILIRDFSKFLNRFSTTDPHIDPFGGDNLFFLKNPKWKPVRTKISPIFTSGKMKQMFPFMQEIGYHLNDYLSNLTSKSQDGCTFVDVKEICALFSTDVISTIAFGVEANSLTDPNGIFRSTGKKIFDFTWRRAVEIYIIFFSPKLAKTLSLKLFPPETKKFLHDMIWHMLNDRIQSGKTRNDLIDILVNFFHEAEADKEKKHLTLQGDSLTAQAGSFFAAGFETSSSTMSFSLYELARNEELQQRLRNEIRDMLQKNNGQITFEAMNGMEFLKNVVQEVLRLYPVMPYIDRECTLQPGEADVSLEPYLKFAIPNGMPVYIPVFSLQRDPKFFPEPLRFNPDRFSSDQLSQNDFTAYLPFGMGPRNCVGARFGILQTKVGLVNFLRNHRVTINEKTPSKITFNPCALILQSVDGVPLNIVYDPLL